MRVLFHRKIALFFQTHWIKLLIVFGLITLIVLAVIGLASLESFYLHLTLAQLPLQTLMVIVHALIFVYMYMTVFRGGFAKMERGLVKSAHVQIHFNDVIGIDEAKQEAWEVVHLLRDRKKLQKMGGKVVRGLLMVGPPGCGKTLLAKAIATEAGVPFMSMAASEFTEIFVGVGASRMRKLFKRATRLAHAHGACIVFIDEIDAIGSTRSFSYLGGGMEKNTTQNQLLVQMDGLTGKQEDVIVIAATNAAENILDPALLRPGRFDRKIYIDRPDLEGREKLFKYYLGKVKHDKTIDIGRLSRRCVHKSPADIENVVKEAALIATRKDLDQINYKEISEALERVDMGLKRRKKMTDNERRMTAYHEAGHAIALYILHPTDDVFKATIIAHGGALGMVVHHPREELFTHGKEKLLADIKVSLSGYAAEKMKFNTTSSGVSGDFHSATQIAHAMVWQLGMGPKGYVGNYTIDPARTVAGITMSDKFKEDLDAQTQEIMQKCLKDVEDLLKKEEKILDRFAKELLEKEELEYDEIEAIFKEFGKSQLNPAPTK